MRKNVRKRTATTTPTRWNAPTTPATPRRWHAAAAPATAATPDQPRRRLPRRSGTEQRNGQIGRAHV